MRRTPDIRVRRIGEHIGGYGVLFGDVRHTDMYQTYFTAKTDFWLDSYQGQPVIFDHAMGYLPQGFPQDMPRHFKFGHVVKVEPDDVGLWIEAQIDDHNAWVNAVLDLIDQGALGWSSGSVPHLVTQERDGWLSSWPVVEWSTTATPAEPRGTDVMNLRHYVNTQGTTPGAGHEAADEAAPAPGTGLVERPSINRKGDYTMTLHLNENTVKALVWAYAESNAADVWAAIKQDGGGANMIATALQPLAAELAGMAGASEDDTLAYLIAWVADHAAGEAEEPDAEEPESVEEEPMPMMSVDPNALDAAVEQAVAKALQARLPDHPKGQALTPKAKAVGQLGRAEKPLTLARWIKAVATYDHEVLRKYHPRIKAGYTALGIKALGIDPDTAGGYLVPVEQSTQTIELLRDTAKVLPLCRTIPMSSATMTIPSQTGGATAYWTAENGTLTPSEETFGQKLLVAKKLTVLVKISNELLNDSDPSVDALIREDIARVAALKIDHTILEGAGGLEPLGLLNMPNVTKTDLNAAPTYANLSGAVSRVEVENVIEDPAWAYVFHPRLKDGLRQLEDTAGNLIYAGPGAYQQSLAGPMPGTLLGYPFATTTQITVDTGNSNQTDMYFGQWNDLIVGQRQTLEIAASNVAGEAFETDQTWIRAILRMDWVLRHDESIEVLTDAQ